MQMWFSARLSLGDGDDVFTVTQKAAPISERLRRRGCARG
jgi:hypothetical protein